MFCGFRFCSSKTTLRSPKQALKHPGARSFFFSFETPSGQCKQSRSFLHEVLCRLLAQHNVSLQKPSFLQPLEWYLWNDHVFGRTLVRRLASAVMLVGLYCWYNGVGVCKSSPDLPDKSCQEVCHPSHRAAWAALDCSENPAAVLPQQKLLECCFSGKILMLSKKASLSLQRVSAITQMLITRVGSSIAGMHLTAVDQR